MIILKVFLYHLNNHKWSLLLYLIFIVDIVTFVMAMLSLAPHAYITQMIILTLLGITLGLKLKYEGG